MAEGPRPICFCCDVEHEAGLEVFAAPVLRGEQVAAVWHTREDWGDEDGFIPDPYAWTALDCPGQFAFLARGIRTGLLGRITGQLHQRARADETHLVTGRRIGVEGKKHFAGTALWNESGALIASARAVWIGRF